MDPSGASGPLLSMLLWIPSAVVPPLPSPVASCWQPISGGDDGPPPSACASRRPSGPSACSVSQRSACGQGGVQREPKECLRSGGEWWSKTKMGQWKMKQRWKINGTSVYDHKRGEGLFPHTCSNVGLVESRAIPCDTLMQSSLALHSQVYW